MKVYILLILLFSYIESRDIPGTYDFNTLLSAYISPENDMIIYNPKNSSLIKYKYNSNIPFYTNAITLNITKFPKNSSEDISDIHFHFDYINSSSINISYFNENYTSYYIFNSNTDNIITDNITYKFTSLEVKEKNILILFLHPKISTYNSSINIVQFDYKNEEKLKIIKTYSFQSQKNIINCNCVSASTNNNNIICGFIEEQKYPYTSNKTYIKYLDLFEYNLIYFSESAPSPIRLFLNNHTLYSVSMLIDPDTRNGILIDNFIKLIPLSEEKYIYCFDESVGGDFFISNSRIKCGLAQVQNNKIEIKSSIYLSDKNKNTKRDSYDNYITKNILDGVKINDQQVILSYYYCERKIHHYYETDFYKYKYYIKITIKNDKLSMEPQYDLTTSSTITQKASSGFFALYLLKNSDDNFFPITIFNGVASFEEKGYTTCSNSSINLYNADTNSKIEFDIISLFENNDIIFLNNSIQTLHSITDQNSKPINYSVVYNKKNIRYNYNPQDYDYIKNNSVNLLYTGSLNEKKSRTCQLTIKFYNCQKECEICTNQECYDRNKKLILFPTNLERYFFILPLSILVMLIVLIFFTFAKCCVKQPLPNYGGNLVQSEMPLIQS